MFSNYWYFILFTATLYCFSEAEVLIMSTESGLVFDGNKKNVEAVTPDNSQGQHWRLKGLKNGYFVIVNAKNKLVLDVQKGCQSGQNIIVYKKNSGNNQQFRINLNGTIGTKCNQNLILQIKNGNVETVPRAQAGRLDVRFKFVEVKLEE